jgi:hypothetical protein
LNPAIIFGDYYEPREEAFIDIFAVGDWAISFDSSGGWFAMLARNACEPSGGFLPMSAMPLILAEYRGPRS